VSQPSRVWFGASSFPDDDADEHREARSRPGRRTSRRGIVASVRVAVVGLTFALMSVLVITTSQATFTDTADSTTNAFTAGDIDLVDDDLGSAIFTVVDMEPGQSVADCIVVTYQGSIPDPSRVSVYSGGYTDSGDFGTYLNLTIEEGTGGSFGDCTGFSLVNSIQSGSTLAAFNAASTNYANGVGVWDPSGTPASMTYRITVELDAATPNAEQGESVTGLTFTWEIQN
jgi:hypothetical protein